MVPEFDGKRFGYPGGDPIASPLDVLRWAVTRRPARWPRRLPNPPPSPIEPRVAGERLRVTFVNHASVLIQAAGLNVLTDPVWSKRASPLRFAGPARHRAPGIAFDALPPIDAVLVSHAHYDHMDLATIARLRERDDPLVLVPLANARHLARTGDRERVVELDWWDTRPLHPGGETEEDAPETHVSTGAAPDRADAVPAVTLVPSRHWSSRRLGDENRALWGGFVLRLPGGAVYFAGDTGYGDGAHFHEARRRLGPLRLALLPIGAYEPRWFMRPQHMNPAEAVRAFVELEAEQALAIHFGTFRLTDEAHDAPPRALAAALEREGIPPGRFRALDNGTAWDVP